MSASTTPHSNVQSSATGQSSEVNRRSSKRMAVRTSVTVEIRKGAMGLGANIAAQFLDISEGGVRVIVKSDLPKQAEVEVSLTGHGIRKPIKRLATVCWSMKLESGEFAMGLNFDKRIAYQEMTNFARP
jgi:c-di-GMP-binding flagellar brake protein YcgR